MVQEMIDVVGFNSTMVRLKGGRHAILKCLTAQFQFHNGSIKRNVWEWEVDLSGTFQFHNGSIKSQAP